MYIRGIIKRILTGCDNMGVISVFVDESGIIAKHPNAKTPKFVISMVFVKDIDLVKRVYKKETLKLIKHSPTARSAFETRGELKGSDVSESQKSALYCKLLKKCRDSIELGIIVLDNCDASSQLRSVAARGFNFLIKDYLLQWFFKYSKFRNEQDLALNFIIDERNIATNARATLREYLNTEIGVGARLVHQEISVNYKDSKQFYLIRLSDFIANSVFRMVNKHDNSGNGNEANLKSLCCCCNFYYFPYHI